MAASKFRLKVHAGRVQHSCLCVQHQQFVITCPAVGGGRRPPDMEGSYKCTE